MNEAVPLPAAIDRLLASCSTVVLGTAGPDGPWVAPLYYAHCGSRLFFLSSARSRHVQHLSDQPQIVATIFRPARGWRQIEGIQAQGIAHPLDATEQDAARHAYRAKFSEVGDSDDPDLAQALASAGLYAIDLMHIRHIRNRKRLGERQNWRYDGLAWNAVDA